MARVLVSQPLRRYADDRGELEAEGGTVGDVLRALAGRFPELAPRLLREDGTLSPRVIVYLGGRDIRLLDGDRTRVETDSELKLFAALAGG